MPRYKQSDRDEMRGETRQLLLETAAVEFARDGYLGANIDRISRNAGYAKGTVYNYFASKRALMEALIDETAAAHFAFVAGQVRQESDPRRRLERFFAAGFAWIVDHPARAQVMVTTLNGADIGFKRRLFEVYQPMFRLVNVEILTVGMEQGVFRQVEPVSTAGLVMTIYLGTASQLNEQGEHWLAPQAVADFVLKALR